MISIFNKAMSPTKFCRLKNRQSYLFTDTQKSSQKVLDKAQYTFKNCHKKH